MCAFMCVRCVHSCVYDVCIHVCTMCAFMCVRCVHSCVYDVCIHVCTMCAFMCESSNQYNTVCTYSETPIKGHLQKVVTVSAGHPNSSPFEIPHIDTCTFILYETRPPPYTGQLTVAPVVSLLQRFHCILRYLQMFGLSVQHIIAKYACVIQYIGSSPSHTFLTDAPLQLFPILELSLVSWCPLKKGCQRS